MSHPYPAAMNRTSEHPGVWEHKGKVAAVGIGHSPTYRRWDGRPETCVGAQSIIALRLAMEDAGVTPDQVDGLVISDITGSHAHGVQHFWYQDGRPYPTDVINAFNPTDNPTDGIVELSLEWLLKNMPELKNVKYAVYGGGCMSTAIPIAAQSIGEGLTHTCLVLKGWHNLDMRYRHGGVNALDRIGETGQHQDPDIPQAPGGRGVPGFTKWDTPWGPHISYYDAIKFQRYLWKYGKTHEMLAPFVVQSRKNGLLFPEGYWAQHRPEELTVDDYNNARWIAKPSNLYDNDIPIHSSTAYLMTTPERARDMKQKPVYILNHLSHRPNPKQRTTVPTLEEVERGSFITGQMIYEGAGITPNDLSFENMFDGFSLFHVFHIEGLRIYGIKPGDALDLFQTDISPSSWTPINPSGGDIGSGRNRCWMHTDCIQQIQGRAGARQIRRPAEVGVAGGMVPPGGTYTVYGSSPD